MATHSSVLAWRIPGMGEPGGLLSMGSHRVRHYRSNLAATAAAEVGGKCQFIVDVQVQWARTALQVSISCFQRCGQRLWEDHLQYCDQLAEDGSVRSGGKYPRAKVIVINTLNHQSKSKPTKQKWLWGKKKNPQNLHMSKGCKLNTHHQKKISPGK